MTTQQIFHLATKKAYKNGWFPRTDSVGLGSYADVIFSHDFAKAFWGEERDIKEYREIIEGDWYDNISVEEYNKKPDNEKNYSWKSFEPVYEHEGWQYHLQQMVISEDPIKYLQQYL